jgi:hypothetical protein
MQPPFDLPYKEGQPVPAGYRLVEEPRWGLVTAGWVLTAVGYGVPLLIASSVRFENESTWLAIPFAGPWLTLGHRESSRSAEEARQDPTSEAASAAWAISCCDSC